jgi:hypothetical protein
MRKSRSFTASGFDALEGRVVLSHGAASVATGVIHGHKAQLVAADFASFQTSYNNTITPLVKEIQNTSTSSDQVYSDEQQISTDTTNMINSLGNQLAKQLHSKMYTRIRTVVTGASTPGIVGFASTSPSSGSLLATLNSLPNDALANPSLVNNLITVYQDALISGHSATAVRGDFINFQQAFDKAIPPLVASVQSASTPAELATAQQALDTEIVTLVNGLGTQLSNDLGAPAQPAIRNLITGVSSSSSSVSFTSGAPVSGSLMATLMSVPSDDLDNWDFLNDLVSAYASSSRSFT